MTSDRKDLSRVHYVYDDQNPEVRLLVTRWPSFRDPDVTVLRTLLFLGEPTF